MEEDIRDIRELVNESIMPQRILVDGTGHSVPPDRAFREHEISPGAISVILVREDGWTLGAPGGLEDEAFDLWKDQWKWFCPRPMVVGIPIDRWGEREHLTARARAANTHDLQHGTCSECGDDCKGGGVIVLHSQCHKGASLTAQYEVDNGVLVLMCGECDRMVATFAISDIRERTCGVIEVQ